MARSVALAAVSLAVLSGCIAPAATIGAVDQGGSGTGSDSGDLTTSGMEPPGSSEGSSTTAAAGCERECVSDHDCQLAQCVEADCVVSFRDELCEPGEVCGPLGCEASPLSCDDPRVAVCEDFEGDTFAEQWDGGSVMRSADPVNAGLGAGWIKLAAEEREQLNLVLDPPMNEGLLAVRAFVWLPSEDAIEEWSILYEIFGTSNAGTERFSLDLRDQAGLIFVNLLTPEATVFGNQLLTPGAWSCVELRVQISQGQGEVEVRVDDVPVLGNGPGIDTLPFDGVARINVGGLASEAHTGNATYGLDDIVVATAPIGCDLVP